MREIAKLVSDCLDKRVQAISALGHPIDNKKSKMQKSIYTLSAF